MVTIDGARASNVLHWNHPVVSAQTMWQLHRFETSTILTVHDTGNTARAEKRDRVPDSNLLLLQI